MSVATKGKRKLQVDERLFYWAVFEDEDNLGIPTVSVLSEDKHVIAKYQLSQADSSRFAVIIGAEFQETLAGGPWRRFRCPRFETRPNAFTPSNARAFVRWLTEKSPETPVAVDWQGEAIH